jgi:hypothetical protein
MDDDQTRERKLSSLDWAILDTAYNTKILIKDVVYLTDNLRGEINPRVESNQFFVDRFNTSVMNFDRPISSINARSCYDEKLQEYVQDIRHLSGEFFNQIKTTLKKLESSFSDTKVSVTKLYEPAADIAEQWSQRLEFKCEVFVHEWRYCELFSKYFDRDVYKVFFDVDAGLLPNRSRFELTSTL